MSPARKNSTSAPATQLARFRLIHQAITAGSRRPAVQKLPNAVDFARICGVSYKTIHRDLAFMRDQLLLPLAYDQHRYGWYYSAPVHVCSICCRNTVSGDTTHKVK